MDKTHKHAISTNTDIANGKPVITGTRVRVEDVLDLLSQNKTIKEICKEYEVSEEQVQQAIRYARDELSQETKEALTRARNTPNSKYADLN